MRLKTFLAGLSLATGLAVLAAWATSNPALAQERVAAAVQNWEYKIVLPVTSPDLDPRTREAQFNKLGAEGWELCAAHSATRPEYCVFKRPAR